MGLIPYSPVDGGMLAGAVEKERNWRRGGTWVTDRLDRDRAKITAYEDLCRRIGHPPAQVAVAWLLHQPAVTAPIVGPRTLAHLEDAVAETDIRLDAETLAALGPDLPRPRRRGARSLRLVICRGAVSAAPFCLDTATRTRLARRSGRWDLKTN